MLLMDAGLAIVLLVLAIFLLWRLIDLFRRNGRWSEEYAAERKINAETDIRDGERKLKELQSMLDKEAE
jgi:hypothetical protein